MQYPRTIRNFNAFVDGISYCGCVIEGKLPELKLQTAAHRGGGMDAPVAVDLGMEAMSAELTLIEWAPELITLIGNRRQMVLRPAAMGEYDFTADAYVSTLRGRWSTTNFGDLKPGDEAPIKLMLEADYFRMQKDGDELFEIDVEAGKRVIGGVDQLADLRAAMGI